MNWISVKKQLPEYSKRVLVSAYKDYENGDITALVTIADRRFTNYLGDNWMDEKDEIKYWTVTHWQPLPEAATL